MLYIKKKSRRCFSHIVNYFLQFMRTLSLCIKVTFHLCTISVWFAEKECPENIFKKIWKEM